MSAGRPSKLTPAFQREICEHIAKGATRESACALVELDYSNFWRWFTGKDEAHKEFRKAVKKAEAKFQMEAVEKIRTHGGESWQALAWELERRFPLTFGIGATRYRAEVTAEFMQRLKALPADVRRQIAEVLEAEGTGEDISSEPAEDATEQ